MKTRVLSIALTGFALMAGTVGLVLLPAQAAPSGGDKVYVCKYVGQPGVNETLQTGQNPIEVSVHSIKDWPVAVGSYFADAQGRSYVLGFVPMDPEPTAADCPGHEPSPSPSESPSPSDTTPPTETIPPTTTESPTTQSPSPTDTGTGSPSTAPPPPPTPTHTPTPTHSPHHGTPPPTSTDPSVGGVGGGTAFTGGNFTGEFVAVLVLVLAGLGFLLAGRHVSVLEDDSI
jgi:hypothetical protein